MTARTISFLNGSYFQDGQAAGSIVPVRVRDLIDTLQTRTSGIVRVTDPEFGADPTGVADSTTAFQNAMAGGVALVPGFQADGVTRAVYTLNNCKVPSGAVLVGFGPPAYPGGGLSSDNYVRPIIQGAASAVRVFNVDGTQGARFEGLLISGAASSPANNTDLISGGGRAICIRDCCLEYGNHGIGGAVSGSTQTYPAGTWEGYFFNNTISSCITGIGDVIDCFIHGGSIAECTNGTLISSNASTASFIGTRFEWNGRTGVGASPNGVAGYGANLVGTADIQFIGCMFDANGAGGIYFNGAGWCNLVGCSFRRNGGNVTSGTTLVSTSAHILFNNAFNIQVSGGCYTRVDSDGTVNCPAFTASFAGSNTAISLTGNDLSGCQGATAGGTKTGPINSNTAWRTGTPPSGSGLSAFVLKGNFGTGTAAQDVDTR